MLWRQIDFAAFFVFQECFLRGRIGRIPELLSAGILHESKGFARLIIRHQSAKFEIS
jgi:hypothetical protein